MSPRGKKVRYRTGEKALTPNQQDKVLAVIDSYFDEILIKLTLALGCRRSDIVRICWVDVDLEENMVSYKQAKKRDKTHNAFISDAMALLLKKYKSHVKGPYLFPSSNGSHIAGRTAYNIFNRYMVKAGLIEKGEPYPFHALRATCIKNCDRAGWKDVEAAKHVDDTIEVIQYHYKAPSMNEMIEAAREKPII